MRPSNSDLSKAVAGEVLAEVFSTLPLMGYALTLSEMRTLMDRVESRLTRAHGNNNSPAASNGKPQTA